MWTQLQFQLLSLFSLILLSNSENLESVDQEFVDAFRSSTQVSEVIALYDNKAKVILYKDPTYPACFLQKNFDRRNNNEWEDPILIRKPIRNSTNIKVSEFQKEFCTNLPVFEMDDNPFLDVGKPHRRVHRNRRSASSAYHNSGSYNFPGSQTQVQGNVAGKGYFSGQAQSLRGMLSQSQLQLGGLGLTGNLASLAGRSQAAVRLGTKSGSGQISSSGMGPSASELQLNLGEANEESRAHAMVMQEDYTSGQSQAIDSHHQLPDSGSGFRQVPSGHQSPPGSGQQTVGRRQQMSPMDSTNQRPLPVNGFARNGQQYSNGYSRHDNQHQVTGHRPSDDKFQSPHQIREGHEDKLQQDSRSDTLSGQGVDLNTQGTGLLTWPQTPSGQGRQHQEIDLNTHQGTGLLTWPQPQPSSGQGIQQKEIDLNTQGTGLLTWPQSGTSSFGQRGIRINDQSRRSSQGQILRQPLEGSGVGIYQPAKFDQTLPMYDHSQPQRSNGQRNGHARQHTDQIRRDYNDLGVVRQTQNGRATRPSTLQTNGQSFQRIPSSQIEESGTQGMHQAPDDLRRQPGIILATTHQPITENGYEKYDDTQKSFPQQQPIPQSTQILRDETQIYRQPQLVKQNGHDRQEVTQISYHPSQPILTNGFTPEEGLSESSPLHHQSQNGHARRGSPHTLTPHLRPQQPVDHHGQVQNGYPQTTYHQYQPSPQYGNQDLPINGQRTPSRTQDVMDNKQIDSYPITNGRRVYQRRTLAYYPAQYLPGSQQPHYVQQTINGHSPIQPHSRPVPDSRNDMIQPGTSSDTSRCQIVTFACTIIFDNNGKSKLCRPKQGDGNMNQASGICCC